VQNAKCQRVLVLTLCLVIYSFKSFTMLYSKAVHVAVVQLCSCSYIFVQLLDPGVECAKYSKELSKVLSSDPVQKMEQRNKVIDISFMLTYM